MVDWLTPAQRSFNMSRIRASHTKPERVLRAALFAAGVRGWRNHRRGLAGASPADIAFTRWQVAIFVDGSFWHGHPSAFRHGKSGAYWDEKIGRNKRRDAQTNRRYRAAGWRVLRYWDFEIDKELDRIIKEVERELTQRKLRGAA